MPECCCGENDFSEAENNNALCDLGVGGNCVGDDNIEALSESLNTNTRLTTLTIERTNIGRVGAMRFAEILKQNTMLSKKLCNKLLQFLLLLQLPKQSLSFSNLSSNFYVSIKNNQYKNYNCFVIFFNKALNLNCFYYF